MQLSIIGLAPGRPAGAIAVGDLALDHGGPEVALAGSVGRLDLAGEEREGQESIAGAADLVLDRADEIARGRSGQEIIEPALQAQLLVFTAQAGQLVPLRRRQCDVGRRWLRFSSAVPAVSVGHPVPDRLGGRLKLSGQILRVAAGADQIDHLLPELRRVRGTSWA